MRSVDPAGLRAPALVRRVIGMAGSSDAIVLGGHAPADMVAAALLARRRRPPLVLLTECTWALSGKRAERARQRSIMRAVDGPHIAYSVGSTAERATFTRTWGVDPERVFYVPWFHYLSDEELAQPDLEGSGIFAGGDSYRDYPLLIEAVRGLPVEVTIAALRRSDAMWSALPANVTAVGVPHERFMALMREAATVATPLTPREDRSAGQATYLNAMALGKLAIVTETLGVRDYVEHGRTGLVLPPGDLASMRKALEWALDPANAAELAAIRARARDVARTRFGPEQYLANILGVVDARLASRG